MRLDCVWIAFDERQIHELLCVLRQAGADLPRRDFARCGGVLLPRQRVRAALQLTRWLMTDRWALTSLCAPAIAGASLLISNRRQRDHKPQTAQTMVHVNSLPVGGT